MLRLILRAHATFLMDMQQKIMILISVKSYPILRKIQLEKFYPP